MFQETILNCFKEVHVATLAKVGDRIQMSLLFFLFECITCYRVLFQGFKVRVPRGSVMWS